MKDIIFPLAGSEEPKDKFVVCDIENEETGEVIMIGVSWRDRIGNIVHITLKGWEEFTFFMREKLRVDDSFKRVWAHNGGGWDWCSYMEWLLKNRKRFPKMELRPVIVQSKYVVLEVEYEVTWSKNKDGNLHRESLGAKFCDSLYLMRSGLDDLSKKLLGEGKVDTGGIMAWELWRKDRKKFFEYLEGDCNRLLRCLEKFYEIIRSKICPLDKVGNTIGSSALKIYRTYGMWKKQFETESVAIRIPSNQKGHKALREMLRQAYSGGRVEVFKYGYFQSLRVFDINSLYPSVMRDHYYPVNAETEKIDEVRNGVPGVYHVRFSQPNRNLPAVLMMKGKSCYEGEGYFFSPELELLKKIGGKVEVIEGYIFTQSKKIFADFINDMWALRKSDYKGPLGMVCKFLMNSLYGKFCERPKNTQLILLSGSIYENIQRIDYMEYTENEKRDKKEIGRIHFEILDEQNGVYNLIDEEAVCGNEHVGIGGLITSWARVELYRKFLGVGLKNLVYCDTDSIHTTGELSTGNELGELKEEHHGEGVYAGKKLYALRGVKDGKSYEKITVKGVSFNSSKSAAVINFDSILEIVNGAEKVCEFSQPATAKETLKGKQPCQILRKNPNQQIRHNRKRTIRRT